MKGGTIRERGKGMGRKGGGGDQYTSNLGLEWTGIAPQRKGGIPSKLEGFRNRKGIFQAKEDNQGVIKGTVHVPPI